MAFELPKLPYAYDALEPHIDARTMEIHHTKHHQAYTDNLNKAIAGTELENMSIEEIFTSFSGDNKAVRNNGGGYYNHNLFWTILSPNGGGPPSGEMAGGVKSTIWFFYPFKKKVKPAAAHRFWSCWAWLCVASGNLEVCSTPNQDNPLMPFAEGCAGTPILGLDVWEHAYYLNYQNRRPDYINAFWNVVNWEEVSRRYSEAK